MELKTFLQLILVLSLVGGLVLYLAGRYAGRKEQALWADGTAMGDVSKGQPLRWLGAVLSSVLLKSYALGMKCPPLKLYIWKVRTRLSIIHRYNEFELRRQTMKFVYGITISFTLGILLLTILNPSWSFFLLMLLAATVIQDLLLDGYVNQLEKKLLEQMLDFFTAVRHAYHRHGMVSDAIEEAGEETGHEVGVHAHLISEALENARPDEALEKYYETAPNRFLKAFAGISRLILEYGDRKRERGSLYLRGISSLTGEIQLELIRKNRLDYLLKGLHVIALLPVFFTKPIEIWARGNFPLMDQFYLSKAGILIKLSIFLIILLCYILLQKLKSEVETSYRAEPANRPWEAVILECKGLAWICRCFVPSPASVTYYRLTRLIQDTNERLRVELFQVRRICSFIACFLLALGFALALHFISQQRIMTEPPREPVFFGSIPQDMVEAGRHGAELDAAVMRELGMKENLTYDAISESVMAQLNQENNMITFEDIVVATQRILDKLDRWNGEYLKWWEMGLALMAGLTGYYFPLWALHFQRVMRLMDMKHEVYQFQTMIAILRELERISVEEILDWLASYAVIFRTPLQRCLLNYGHGAEQALRELKDEVSLDEFQRLTDKLILATEKITIADAFDDLDTEMAYHFECRRLDYEKSLDTRAGLGRMIGFAPMYSLVFAYLVIPLIWMSFEQMGFYFEQIQKL
ncbi:hypothetical protein [Paenibacillus sanguinis]|uniref:hypothetical protein n=1 Tax=Paenibacillus sanguinis TaxID=225906 RepID=UPI00037BCAE1|nr:hypothetical protein [Paenibacillus sanguinis]